MAIDERARHEVHQGLVEVLGSQRAADLMSMLPPQGWAGLATKSDIALTREATRADIAELRDSTRSEIAELRDSTRSEIAELRESTRSEIAELRAAMIAGFAELREAMAVGFADLRVEMHSEIRRLDHRIDTARFSLLAWTVGTVAALNSSLVLMVLALT